MNKNIKCCVYTRAFYETPYLDFFIEHYIKLGFDHIIILKSSREKVDVPSKFSQFTTIYELVENSGDDLLGEHDHCIKKSRFDWVLGVDIDEILLLNKKYRNIKHFLKEQLQTYPQLNVFYFRWGIIEAYNKEVNKNLTELIQEYNVFENCHIKSLMKISDIQSINPHCGYIKSPSIYFENNVLNTIQVSNHAITKYSYDDSILIHLHTRNIHNLIIKSIYTVLHNKSIIDIENFRELINNFDIEKSTEEYLILFKKYIGKKATIPFGHAITSKIQKETFDKMNIFNDYNYQITNNTIENELVDNMLKEYNINQDKYKLFVNIIDQAINNLNIFKKN